MEHFDAVIVGGGIVGLATARAVQQQYRWSVAVVEKENVLGAHQTGHNSGVLHSGIYYKAGSLKATLCRAGKREMEAFCREQGIDLRICGKVIVATEAGELPRLDALYERGVQNGVAVEMIDRNRLNEIEPHAAGIRAIHVKEAGVVDFGGVVRQLRELIERQGGVIMTGRRVSAIAEGNDEVVARAGGEEVAARFMVNCAGLHADRVARLISAAVPARILPFRGEYYAVKREAAGLCRTLIYPVPDPRFPFLGVHMTRSVDDEVECGPNAVLAFAREGYRKRDVNLRDLAEMAGYRGFWRLAARYWRTGAAEMWRSFSRRAFVRAVQRLVPDLREGDLEAAPAGVRAQAIAPSGELVDDFAISSTRRVVNVINAPSPAATASLAIGSAIAARLGELGAVPRVALAVASHR